MKRVIELIRVSTEQQAADDRASVPAQRAVNRRTCAQNGLEIVKSIEMADVSGAAVLSAPEIRKLIELMQSPDIHGVVAREFSRLMRPENFADYALLQAFVDTNTVLYLPDGPLDLNSKTGRLMGTIRAAIAGLERTEILERVFSAKEEKRRRGELAQSSIVLPFGVGYEDGRGFFYKPEAERVKEAFRRFLGGEHNYNNLANLVGVTPRGVHLILRNPIWTGWRVIDKKRDPSPAGKYKGADGRQSDRRKVRRAQEEIIRVQVIKESLISEAEFHAVQRIMDLKQTRHWRSNPAFIPHFTYNGFLTCSSCGELVYTYTNRRENRYYVCKAKQYPKSTGHNCGTSYMRRELLESNLDGLFGERLTDVGFLREIFQEHEKRSGAAASQSKILRLQNDLDALHKRRQRVLDTFFEGVISREERDSRLGSMDRDVRLTEELLLREEPQPGLSPADLALAFEPFYEWSLLNRSQKRQLLAAIVPEVHVADCNVSGLMVMAPARHDENIHTDKDSLQPPA